MYSSFPLSLSECHYYLVVVVAVGVQMNLDPAFDVMSPFRNAACAEDGTVDLAIQALSAPPRLPAAAAHTRPEPSPPPAVESGTACVMCGRRTGAIVPTEGYYCCTACVANREAQGRPYRYPAGTFKCCPAVTEANTSSVVRCAGCGEWYHSACMGITSPLAQQYVELATTAWYCPEPSCSELVLQKLEKNR